MPDHPGLLEEPSSKFSKKDWAISIVIVGFILTGFILLASSGGFGVPKPPEGEMTAEWAFRDMVHEAHGYRFERITSIENSGGYSGNRTTTPSGLMCTITYEGSSMSPIVNGQPSQPEGAWPLLAWSDGGPGHVSKPGNLEVDGRRVSTVTFKASEGEFIVMSHDAPLEEIAEVFGRVRIAPAQFIWFLGELERRGEPLGPKSTDILFRVATGDIVLKESWRTNAPKTYPQTHPIVAAANLWWLSGCKDRRGIEAVLTREDIKHHRISNGATYGDFSQLLTIGQANPKKVAIEHWLVDLTTNDSGQSIGRWSGGFAREEGGGARMHWEDWVSPQMRDASIAEMTNAWLDLGLQAYLKLGSNYRDFSYAVFDRVEVALMVRLEEDPALRDDFFKAVMARRWEEDRQTYGFYLEAVRPRVQDLLMNIDTETRKWAIDYTTIEHALKHLHNWSDPPPKFVIWNTFQRPPLRMPTGKISLEDFCERDKTYQAASDGERQLLEQLWKLNPNWTPPDQ